MHAVMHAPMRLTGASPQACAKQTGLMQGASRPTCAMPPPQAGVSDLGLRSAACAAASSSALTRLPARSRYTVAAPRPLSPAPSLAKRSRSACACRRSAWLQHHCVRAAPAAQLLLTKLRPLGAHTACPGPIKRPGRLTQLRSENR
jgi:hypothetical protein